MDKPMTMTKVYDKLVKLQRILWRGDDRLSQDSLFEAQELLAVLTLEVSRAAGKSGEELVEKFPWLYRRG